MLVYLLFDEDTADGNLVAVLQEWSTLTEVYDCALYGDCFGNGTVKCSEGNGKFSDVKKGVQIGTRALMLALMIRVIIILHSTRVSLFWLGAVALHPVTLHFLCKLFVVNTDIVDI